MTPSRSLLAAGLAAVMLAPSIASAQRSRAPAARATPAACLQPAEKTAFDIRALQSQLMVVALTCGQQDDYNVFVRRHQSDLAAAFRGVSGHFRRVGGRSAQSQLDQYITNLANGQSQVGISRGSFFCREQGPLFQQAVAASSSAELAQLSVAREVPQALSAQPCAAGAAQPAATPAPSRRAPAPRRGTRTAAASH